MKTKEKLTKSTSLIIADKNMKGCLKIVKIALETNNEKWEAKIKNFSGEQYTDKEIWEDMKKDLLKEQNK